MFLLLDCGTEKYHLINGAQIGVRATSRGGGGSFRVTSSGGGGSSGRTLVGLDGFMGTSSSVEWVRATSSDTI